MQIEEMKKVHFLSGDVSPVHVFTPEDFSDEQKMLEDMVTKFMMNEVYPNMDKVERLDFHEIKRLLRLSGELGLISADIPEEDGGLGLGKVSATIISEKVALGRSFSITFSGQTGIGALPIAYFGTELQKEKYLPGIVNGEKVVAYALTEPSSGTDAMSLKTTAVLSPCRRYYVLNGEKQWITNSAIADVFIVYAKVDGQHFTAFIVEKDYEGLSTSPEEKKMGLKGSSTRSVILDNVHVPVENVIGDIGRGHVIAFNVLNIGRHKIAATSLGTAKRAMELAVIYAKERKQFGQPIANFGLIKQKIADMAIKTYANESSVYRTAGVMQAGFDEMKQIGVDYGSTIARFALECSINKVMSTEALDFVVDEAVQIHGGYGYMAEYEIETLYRDSRINRIFEGTNEINRILIASNAVKNYSEQKKSASIDEDALYREKQKLKLMKKLFHATIQALQQKSLVNFNQEQELAAFVADLVIAIYSIESAIIRTEKEIAAKGEDVANQKLACTKVHVFETSQQMALRALNIINYIGDEEMFLQIPNLLVTSSLDNIFELKREIADFVIQNNGYCY